MSITTQVVILFAVVLVGVICRRLGYFTDESIHSTTQLVVNITLPCTTIMNMQRAFSMEVLQNFLATLAISFALILCALLFGLALFKSRPREKRAVLANLLGFANCGFMGYPIILAVNPDWMIYAVAYNVAYISLAWTLGVSLFCGRENVTARRVLLHPNVVSAAIGIALFCAGITIPDVPAQALTLIGSLTTPLSMLLIGTRVCGIRLRDFKDKDYHITAALRLVVLPLLIYVVMRPLPIAPSVAATVYLLTAMPGATMTGMQAELYGGDTTFAARAIAYTTLLSLLSVPVMSLLL